MNDHVIWALGGPRDFYGSVSRSGDHGSRGCGKCRSAGGQYGSCTFVQLHEVDLTALKDKFQESVRVTNFRVTRAANFMNEFHNRTQTASGASDT